MEKPQHIAIVGAGLVGSMMAIYLAKRGYAVSLFEKRADIRKNGAEEGRSINLALSNRGMVPLEELGLAAAVKNLVIPMPGRMIHNEEGGLNFQPYGKEGQAIYSISRTRLNELLISEAERTGVQIHFRHRCAGLDFEDNFLFFIVNGRRIQVQTDLIIGTDGAYSVVRGYMQRIDRFNYAQHYIQHGYKELNIPPAAGNKLDKHALHIWPRKNYMLIALPNLEGSFTCTLFLPFEGKPSFSSLTSGANVKNFFKKNFPDAYELMPDLLRDYEDNPTSSLVTIKCHPWVKNRTLLMGDASHAIVPFYGQGMNSGFEDCRILNELLNKHADNWEAVLEAFNIQRKADTDAIAELALENFKEMRDLVADQNFLLRKKIEAKIHELYPDKWIPLYALITFNENIPYAKARAIGRKQERIMDEVMKMRDIEKQWKALDFERIVSKLNGFKSF